MKAAIAAAALVLTAGLAVAESDQTMQQDQTQRPTISGQTDRTELAAPRESSPQVAPPAGNEPATTKGDAYDADRTVIDRSDAYGANAERRTRGTGVATGFIAAGIGLALLGLFVRRRNRHDHRFDRRDEDDIDRPGGIGPRL
jgi:hypothetical protein